MPPQIGSLVFTLLIVGLFLLERDRRTHISQALWIPTAWLWINGSRPASLWLAALGYGDAPPTTDSPDRYLDGSPVDRNVFAALLALGLIVLIARRRTVGAILRKNGPLLLFFGYCLLSVAWSDFPLVAFKRWSKVIGDLVMVLVVLTEIDRVAAIKRVMARVEFVLIPLSIMLIKYYPDLARTFDNTDGKQSFTGVTLGKNILGMICMILGLAAEWRVIQALTAHDQKGRLRELVAHGMVLAMVMYLFSLANSMTSLSCFSMASILMIAARFQILRRRPALLHIMVVAMICVSASALFFDMGGGALEAMGRDATLTGRTDVWRNVLKLVKDPLFGTGYESFWLGPRLQAMWSIYWWHPNEAHNGYLEFYLNLGWVGVTLFGLLLITGYRNAVAAYRRHIQIGSLLLAYCVVAVLGNLTEASMKMLNPVWILFLMAVIHIPEQHLQLKQGRIETAPPLQIERAVALRQI